MFSVEHFQTEYSHYFFEMIAVPTIYLKFLIYELKVFCTISFRFYCLGMYVSRKNNNFYQLNIVI
jgi:hypothetical protein